MASAGPPGESGVGEAMAGDLGVMNEVCWARGEDDDGMGEPEVPVGFLE
jgi:hypothetical protein